MLKFIKAVTYFVTFLLVTSSCKSIKGDLGGVYFSKYASDFYCLINLNDRDSTFEYESNALFKGRYSGHWKAAGDSIYLYFPHSDNPIDYIKAYILYDTKMSIKINKTNLYSPILRMKFKKDARALDSELRNNRKVLLLTSQFPGVGYDYNSPDENIDVYVNSQVSKAGRPECLAHEAYRQTFIYVATSGNREKARQQVQGLPTKTNNSAGIPGQPHQNNHKFARVSGLANNSPVG